MSPLRCVVGLFLIAIIGLSEARNSRSRRIVDYEDQICEPRKRHLDEDGCRDCVCRQHGYGSVCGRSECCRVQKRPIEERECRPFGEFETRCHYCKCSSAGNPIDCVEKSQRCMDDILDELDEEKFKDQRERIDSVQFPLTDF